MKDLKEIIQKLYQKQGKASDEFVKNQKQEDYIKYQIITDLIKEFWSKTLENEISARLIFSEDEEDN